MDVTTRGLGVAGLAVALAALAPLFQRPLLLVGAAGLGGWLLARQWRFARRVAATNDALVVDQQPARDPVTVDESVPVTLSATLPDPSGLSIRVRSEPPVATDADDSPNRTVTLGPDDAQGQRSYTVDCPVAGSHAFDGTQITFEDEGGLFESSVERESTTQLTVEPKSPPAVHVGQGGDRAMAFGEYATGETGPGLEPASVRQYVPGDSAADIDWKTTARLASPHVREFEIEVDRRATLVFDHRGSMGDGGVGERKLDYARATALAYLQSARRNGEAVGVTAVGDEGVTERLVPNVGDDHYRSVIEVLDSLEPTETAARPAAPGRSPATARGVAATLGGETTTFARTLRPFFADATQYVRRVAEDPLYRAVQDAGATRGSVVHVVLTDDGNPAELRETVRAAGGGGDPVLVFVTPSVLFDPGGLTDLDDAYERYVAFENLRRELSGFHNVEAFEVGPRDRVEALLAQAGGDRQ